MSHFLTIPALSQKNGCNCTNCVSQESRDYQLKVQTAYRKQIEQVRVSVGAHQEDCLNPGGLKSHHSSYEGRHPSGTRRHVE